MLKILFNDGLIFKTFENGKIREYGCDFYNNYIDSARRAAKNSEWKTQGSGARFMGVYEESDINRENDNFTYFNSLDFFKNNENIVYSITVDDYVTVTDGDSADFDATISARDSSLIYFSSKGAGRNGNGEFVKYSPSSVFTYNIDSGDLEEILSENEKSLVKPKDDKNGNLYYILRPEKEKRRSFFGTLLDIILIPWKLFKALFNFIELFTTMFTGKGFSEKSNNPAKTRDKSPKEIFIEDNLINANEEYKNNLRHKDKFAGIAPWSWQLVKRDQSGNVTHIKNGVIDYCVSYNGDIVYTNGKHVVLIGKDGKTQKIADANLCTKVSVCEI